MPFTSGEMIRALGPYSVESIDAATARSVLGVSSASSFVQLGMFEEANQVTVSTAASTVQALSIPEDAVLGRKTGGNLQALTMTELGALLNVDETRVEDLEALMFRMSGGFDGIPRYGADGAPNELVATPTSPAGMTITVSTGCAWVDGRPWRLRSTRTSPTFTAPAASTRIDLLVAGWSSGAPVLTIVQGVEGGSAPSAGSAQMPLAEVSIDVAQTAIESGDITDRRIRL